MPDLHIFKAQVGMFDPVALQNQNVCIHYVQNAYYRKVDFLEALPPFQCIDLGALAATTPSGVVNVVNLDMPNEEFGLFRWWPIDDAQILLFVPRGIARYQLRNIQVPVDMNILVRDPNLVSTEIAVWENNRPAVQAINGHAFQLGAVRLIAIGYRFHTVEITKPVTQREIEVISQMKREPSNQGLKDNDLMVKAFEQERLLITHVWCSGRGIGD